MAYFKINDTDLSMYVSGLKVSRAANYTSQTNAAGNTVVDYINSKRVIEVSIIPLSDDVIKQVKTLVDAFNMTVSYREPTTGELETINVIIPDTEIEYYTIQVNKVMSKAMNLTFTEL